MGGAWVFPGGAVDAHEGEGDERPPRRGGPRARRGGRRSRGVDPATLVRSRAGSRRPRSRSASTPTSSSPRCPTAPSRAVDGEEIVDLGWFTPQGALDAPRARRAAARLPDDQAPRAALAPSPRPTRCSRYARGREVVPVAAAGRHRAARPRGSCCPASRDTMTAGRTIAGVTASLPAELRAGLRPLHHDRVRDDRRRGPADRLAGDALPRTPSGGPASTSRPASATPRRPATRERNPQVALLFSDPTGSGLDAPPMVLVQGTARSTTATSTPTASATRASPRRSCPAAEKAAAGARPRS